MKFEKQSEWEKYLLEKFINCISGGYAVVNYDGKPELLYFSRHTHKGEPWLLEAPNYLQIIDIEDENYKVFEEYGYIIRGDKAYEIITPQTSPFLPETLEILEIIGENESKALDYLLKNY